MKMKFIIILIVTLFSFKSFSYTLFYVDSVNSNVWNEAFSQFFTEQIKVYAGTSKNKATVRIQYKIISTEYGIDYEFNLDEQGYIENNIFYERLLKSISKSIRWSNIARENNADTQKIIEKVDLCDKSYEGKEVYCMATFFSANGGSQTDLIISVDETNSPLDIYKEKFYLSLSKQKYFLNILTNKVQEKIFYSIEQEKKSEGLFN